MLTPKNFFFFLTLEYRVMNETNFDNNAQLFQFPANVVLNVMNPGNES